jgi:hypothetical protein
MTGTNVVIALIPLVALLASLALGRYPGEATLARVRRGPTPGWRRTRAAARGRPTAPTRCPLPRGGTLLGSALAVRAPPVARPAGPRGRIGP